VNTRDTAAMSVLLTGFTPHLESHFSADAIFACSGNHEGAVAPAAALAVGTVGAPLAMSKSAGLLSRLAFWRR
jgi:hypothetical protein